MAESDLFPRFSEGQIDEDPNDSLAIYVGKLRNRIFKTYSEAGKFFGLAHTTIQRYEGGKIKPQLGYVAYLIRRNLEQLEEDQQERARIREEILQDVNTIIETCYPGQKRIQDWDTDLCPIADAFWNEQQRKSREHTRGSELQEPSGNGAEPRPRSLLPKRVSHSTDREQELMQLLGTLQAGRVMTLCGAAGIGKSALGSEAIWRLHDSDELYLRFPDGVFSYTISGKERGLTSLELEDAVLEQLARHFGEKPNPTPAAAAERALAGRQALLFLNGTEQLDDVQRVLDVSGHCGILITSRRRSDAQDELQIIRALPFDETDHSDNAAVALLQAWGRHRVQQYPKDRTASLEICQRVAGHPLALVLIGSYLVSHEQNASDYLVWLKAAPLSALDFESRPQQSIPLLIEHSLRPLPETARQVLAVAGLLALAPFDNAVIAASLGIAPEEAGVLLGKLVDLSLLERPRRRYQFCHALIHVYARQRMEVPPKVVNQLIAHYVHLTQEARQQEVEGYEWLEKEHLHIMAIVRLCEERQDWESLRQLVEAIAEFQDVEGHWTERLIALDAGLQATQHLDRQEDVATFLDYRGVTYRNCGQYDKAINEHQQALAIYEQIGDPRGQVKQLNYLGFAHRPKGEAELAIAYHQRALTLARGIGDRRGEANALGGLAIIYKNVKDDRRELTLPYFEEALAISREIKDHKNEGVWLGNLGLAYEELELYQKAIECYRQALPIAHKTHAVRVEAAIWGNLGRLHTAQERYGPAERDLKKALRLQEEIGDLRGQANQLDILGYLYFKSKQPDKALSYYQKALILNQKLGRRGAEADILTHFGEFYKEQGDVQQAQKYFAQALKLYDSISSRQTETVQKLLDELYKTTGSTG